MTIQHAQTSERTLALPDVTQASLEAPAPLFQLDQVGFAVAGRALLEPLTLSLPARSVVGLIGHNGSGKSTLLKLLSRQQPSSSGTIRFEGRALRAWSDRDYARKVAYLPQQTPPAAGMLVKELVALGRYPWHGALGRFGDIDREKVANAMALTHIEPFADRLVDTLSGGERQRAWIAMLVAQDAECLLLDEPTSALDLSVQAQIIELLRKLQDERGLSYLFISHDLKVVRALCHRVVVMQHGKIVEEGPVNEILSNPKTPYTERLVRAAFEVAA